MHWASEFGYFPAYAVGNFYNAMYYNRMKQELAVDEAVRMGDFEPINRWMTANVFAKADRLSPGEWIKDITGREITSNDFLFFLDEKYSGIYL